MTTQEREIVRVAPNRRLSRSALIGLFVIAISAGLGVYAMFPSSVGGPPLPVEVSLEKAVIDTTGGGVAVLTDVVTVHNPTEDPIGNLSIELNGQYLLIQASPLTPGESLQLPLEVFTDKRSSQRFNPRRHAVTEVVVTGQLVSRARGVSKFEFDEELARDSQH
ncbi:MAG: hypothetical protein AAFX06_22630 [Planctomycetota bacterium]